MNDTLVAQLHRTLLDALRRSRPGSLHRPVTVAEIYQDLVPYRDARASVGFEINADYEHALLRLLAGEGDFARIEPSEVRDKLRMELDSPNPNVGVFRNYAACDVWINADDDAEDSWEEELLDDDADVDPPHRAARFEIAAAEPDVDDDAEDELLIEPEPEVGADAIHDPAVCTFCGADLPHDRVVHFCPFCGTDQSQQPCPACGELLDPLWRFCVACGTRVRPLGDHVN